MLKRELLSAQAQSLRLTTQLERDRVKGKQGHLKQVADDLMKWRQDQTAKGKKYEETRLHEADDAFLEADKELAEFKRAVRHEQKVEEGRLVAERYTAATASGAWEEQKRAQNRQEDLALVTEHLKSARESDQVARVIAQNAAAKATGETEDEQEAQRAYERWKLQQDIAEMESSLVLTRAAANQAQAN